MAGSLRASEPTANDALLELRGIEKRFGTTLANKGIDLDVRAGEVHALIGENGAGKTTLMNIVYGLHTADEGQVIWRGRPVAISSPRDAIALRIGMVHQHFMLVPVLSVAANMALGTQGLEPRRTGLRHVAKRLQEVSDRYGMTVDPWRRVEELTVGQQQRVEILRALLRGADLLILDEPTSVLTPQETDELFEIVKSLASDGKGVVFISHKLSEVLAIADRVTVLRDGAVVSSYAAEEVGIERLAYDMVGRDIEAPRLEGRSRSADVVADVKKLTVHLRGAPVVSGASFSVRRGEIFGIAGVSGNGQAELAGALFGLMPIHHGSVRLLGRDITGLSTRDIMDLGVGYIPEDRQTQGIVPSFSVAENLAVKAYYQDPISRGPWLDPSAVQRYARRIITSYDIRPPDPLLRAGSLSGGNQQKVLVARELSREPAFLIAVQPTQGVDVGAEAMIERLLLKQRDSGVSVLLVSTDLEQIRRLSDRVGVMFEGKMMDVLATDEATVQELGLLMAGNRPG